MTEERIPQQEDTEQPLLAIRKIYLKDVSFETPNSPGVFREDWKPEVNLQLNTEVKQIEADTYEVVLVVTVIAKQGDKTGFLAEVQQSGIFAIGGFNQTQTDALLGSFCPNTLFPYAREAISDLVVKGGFPQLLLAPINFDALYEQQVANASAKETNPE